jgi:hypothetical protein
MDYIKTTLTVLINAILFTVIMIPATIAHFALRLFGHPGFIKVHRTPLGNEYYFN